MSQTENSTGHSSLVALKCGPVNYIGCSERVLHVCNPNGNNLYAQLLGVTTNKPTQGSKP